MKRKSWKRTAAFVTSLAMTTTMLPSDLSGIVTSIVHAEEFSDTDVVGATSLKFGDILNIGCKINCNYNDHNDHIKVMVNGKEIASVSNGEEYVVTRKCTFYNCNLDASNGRILNLVDSVNFELGDELPNEIVYEAGKTWTVTVLPGTVKDETNGTNAESKTFTGVTKINVGGIFNSENAEPVATFRVNKDDTNDYGGLGIYVASVDAEKKELTLTWEDPVVTEGRHINFGPVWDNITSIEQNGNEVHIPGIDQEFTNVKTGYEYVIRSKKALNITPDVLGFENDVRFSTYIKKAEENAADGAKYVYTFVVGRKNVIIAERATEISGTVPSYEGAEVTDTTLKVYEITSTGDVALQDNTIYPDKQYKIVSTMNNLSVFADKDLDGIDINPSDGIIDDGERINYTKTEVEGNYCYTFTAPYGNVYYSLSLPHTHEFTWGKSTNEKELVATCRKNGEENEHVTDFTYNYGLKLTNFTGENVEIANAGSYAVEFIPLTNNGTELVNTEAPNEEYDLALDLLNRVYAQRVIKYSTKDLTTGEWSEPSSTVAKPNSVGTYRVIVDLYETAEAYNEDEPGNFRFVKEFKIVPADSVLTVSASDVYLEKVDKNGSSAATSGKDYYKANINNNGEWLAPIIRVTNGTTELNVNEDYILEGDVTSATEGAKELAVIGIGAYEGYTGELKWYAPSDLNMYPIKVNGEAVDGEGYEYGTSLDFSVSGFDGNQDKITYKAVPYQDAMIYECWSALTSDEQQVVRGYFDGDFVDPVEPHFIDINEDTVLNVLAENELYTKAKAIEDATDREAALEALGYTGARKEYVVLAYYDNSDNPLTSGTILINAKNVTLSLDDARFTYDGENHIGDYELTTNDLITKDASLLNSLKNVEIKYIDTNWVTGETELKNVKAGGYTLGYSKSDVEAVIGNNYTIANVSVNETVVPAVTTPATKPTCFALKAYIDPLNLDGTATATADKTIFVENGKFQKPVITVTAGDDTLVYNTDYSLSGAISAKTAGERVTRIVGKGNYTGSLKVSWKVLGAEDFKKAVDVNWNENSPVAMKVTSNGSEVAVVKFSFNRKATTKADGYEVTDYGYIYTNAAGVDASDLTIENSIEDEKIAQVSSGKTTFNGNYALKVIERGNGVAARGYVTLKHTATGGTYTVYTNPVATTYATLTASQLSAAINLNYGSATTAADKETALVVNDQNAIKVKFTRKMAENAAEGITVKDYGFVYTNSALAAKGETETNEAYTARVEKYNRMNVEDADGKVIRVAHPTSISKNDGTYNVTIRDKGDAIRYRAYVVLQNSEGATYTKYLDIQTAVFDTLSEAQVNRLVTVETKRLAGTYDGDGYYAAKFQTVRSLGEGVKTSDVTVLDYGFIYSNTIDEETANTANFTVEEAEKNVSNNPVKKVKTTNPVATLESGKPGKYGVVIKFDGDEDHSHMINTRGYVKVKDNNTGVVRTVYGDIIGTTCVIRDSAYPTT